VTRSGIEIHFDHTGGGLVTRDEKAPTLFEIAGIDGEWQPANAEISPDGKTVMLSCQAVALPDRARFAWSQIAEPNLMNKEGLPAAAFNTHWPSDPTLGRKVSGGKPILSSHPNSHGWDGGLTDGVWGNSPPGCYATDESAAFPKSVTMDLGKSQTIHLVNYGTPNIGATRTVAISISEDGKTFTEVGRNEFPPKTASRARAKFGPTEARFVRATFIDQHPAQDEYGANFAFLSELEVYAP
jgi:sialate O-acetylesterase